MWIVFALPGGPASTVHVRWLGALALTCAIILAPSVVMADDFPGTPGDDNTTGTANDDTMSGDDGNDTLDGAGGNDTIGGGSGSDSLSGGAGDDEIHAGDDSDTADVVGDSRVDPATGDGVLDGGNDQVYGDGGADSLYGDGFARSHEQADDGDSNGSDTHFTGGDDVVDGGDGDDLFLLGDASTDSAWGDVFFIGGTDEVRGGTGSETEIIGDGTAHALDGDVTFTGGVDLLLGGDGNDMLVGDGKVISLNGTATVSWGNDTIDGGDGDDTIYGDTNYLEAGVIVMLAGGDDTILGGAGNDNIYGQTGHEVLIDGGDGNDYVSGDEGTTSKDLDGGDDNVLGGAGNDTIFGDGSINSTITVTLDGGNDVLNGGTGLDVGDQRIKGDGDITTNGNATIDGGGDEITGGDKIDLIWGDGVIIDCDLVCLVNGGSDTIDAGAGNDGVTADGRVLDSNGDATLVGGADTVTAGDGDDGVTGDGSATTSGSGGTAVLTGGIDALFGGDGNDTLVGDGTAQATTNGTAILNGAADTIDGGAGNDTLVGDGWASAIDASTATLNGGADTLLGGAGDDLMYGETDALLTLQTLVGGDDLLDGGAGNDTLSGQSGNDILLGGEGDDTLDGGAGNDFLCGGSGTNAVQGGAGADLQCAVDDAITVTSKGGTINVAVNEELDDVDAADRAGRRYEIVSISGSIKAVIDSSTGLLTVFSADSDGEIRYRVYLVGGGFESFASIFVTLAEEFREEEDEPEPDPEPSPDPAPTTGPFVPIIDPVDPVVPDKPDLVEPAAKETGEQQAGSEDEGVFGSVGEAVTDLMHSEFAPAAQVTIATTLMMAVTGGVGVSSASLSNARPGSSGGSKGESAPNRSDGTSDGVYVDFGAGEGAGDRSFTWRFPGHAWLDKASVALPVAIAPHSPLLGRLAVDGSELRAMFGTLWMLLPSCGAVLGAMAAAASGGVALPPPLWILIAGAVLTTFDALAGAIASAVFIGAGLVSGVLWNPQGPDFVHSLLVYSGVGFLWTSIPLIGSAIRPFRRLGKGSFRHAWDVAADLSIAALLCAWVTRGLFGAMDNFAGQPTGLGEYADKVALVVLACVALRVLTEHISTRLYKRRLRAVETTKEFPEPTLLASFTGIAIRTALFSFIGHAFIGACWQWWAGTLLYCVPQVLAALDARFDQNRIIQKFLPRGIVALFILLLAGAGLLKLATMHAQSTLETMQWVFVLLAIPPLLLAVLERFTPEDDKKKRTSWTAEILGLGVVVASTWLAFNGWSI